MHQSQIIQHLFQVNSLEDVSRERLETFVEEYPSFGIGHYLWRANLVANHAAWTVPSATCRIAGACCAFLTQIANSVGYNDFVYLDLLPCKD